MFHPPSSVNRESFHNVTIARSQLQFMAAELTTGKWNGNKSDLQMNPADRVNVFDEKTSLYPGQLTAVSIKVSMRC